MLTRGPTAAARRVSRRRRDAVRGAGQSDSGADARRFCRENGWGMAPASIAGGRSFGTVRAFLVVVVALEFAHDGKLLGRQRVPRRPCSSSPCDRAKRHLALTGAPGRRPAWPLDFRPEKSPNATDGRGATKGVGVLIYATRIGSLGAIAGRRRCAGWSDADRLGIMAAGLRQPRRCSLPFAVDFRRRSRDTDLRPPTQRVANTFWPLSQRPGRRW